jgi:hypothetical protein
METVRLRLCQYHRAIAKGDGHEAAETSVSEACVCCVEGLPHQVLPNYTHLDGGWSRDAWKSLAEVAELVPDLAKGQQRLEEQVKTRLSTGGSRSSGWRGYSWLGHEFIMQLLTLLREEQHFRQEDPRYAGKYDDRGNVNVRKRRKSKINVCRSEAPSILIKIVHRVEGERQGLARIVLLKKRATKEFRQDQDSKIDNAGAKVQGY